jgi:hypothetical protein
MTDGVRLRPDETAPRAQTSAASLPRLGRELLFVAPTYPVLLIVAPFPSNFFYFLVKHILEFISVRSVNKSEHKGARIIQISLVEILLLV